MDFKELLRESIHDKGLFKAIFMCGAPGAGKTYMINLVTAHDISPKIVNTDKVYEFLHRDREKGKKYHIDMNKVDKSQQILPKQLEHYLDGMLPLWVDGTSYKTRSVIKRKGILETLGYDVGMVFVNVDLETAMKRAEDRDRIVDLDFIKDAHEQVNENREYYKSHFDYFVEVDNSTNVLTDENIKEMFVKTYKFFTAPIVNTIGKDVLKSLKSIGGTKYSDLKDYDRKFIRKEVSAWYEHS